MGAAAESVSRAFEALTAWSENEDLLVLDLNEIRAETGNLVLDTLTDHDGGQLTLEQRAILAQIITEAVLDGIAEIKSSDTSSEAKQEELQQVFASIEAMMGQMARQIATGVLDFFTPDVNDPELIFPTFDPDVDSVEAEDVAWQKLLQACARSRACSNATKSISNCSPHPPRGRCGSGRQDGPAIEHGPDGA
jgi:hypothetical protein